MENNNDLKKIKDELWHLIKVVIPRLQEELKALNFVNLSELQKLVNEHSAKLVSLENELSAVTSLANANSSQLNGISKSITKLQESYTNLLTNTNGLAFAFEELASQNEQFEKDITSLESGQTDLNNIAQAINNLANQNAEKISALEVSVNTLNTNVDNNAKSISSINTEVSSLQDNDLKQASKISSLQEDYSSLLNKTNGMAFAFEELSSQNEQIEKDIEDLFSKQTTLETSTQNSATLANQNANKIKTLETSVSTINTNINSHGTSITNINNQLSQLDTKVTTNTNSITSTNNKVTTNTNSITSIKNDISSLKTKDTSLSSSITSLQKDYTSLVNKTNGMALAYETISAQNEQFEKDITSLKSQIAALTGGSINSGGLKTGVIYDMRSTDASINLGKTTGLVGSTSLAMDLTKYTYVRVFAMLNTYEAQSFVKITDRKRADFTLSNIATNMRALNYLKYTVATTLDRFQVAYYGSFTYDTTTKAFTATNGAKHDNFYIYRIEGIY